MLCDEEKDIYIYVLRYRLKNITRYYVNYQFHVFHDEARCRYYIEIKNYLPGFFLSINLL